MKNNYKYKKENYNFWVSRLKKKENLVCTNDILLDRIEENQIINRIENNKTILELGCGNGLILKRLIKNKKIKKYYGTDFVKELINICIKKYKSKKINFQTFQVLCLLHNLSFIIKYKNCYYEYKSPSNSQPIILELRENKKHKVLVLNLDKNLNYDDFLKDNIDVSLAIGFTCYYKWTGIKKKISKPFLAYTDEINTLGSFFQSNT
jgi:SAM-dependent methyltransferase